MGAWALLHLKEERVHVGRPDGLGRVFLGVAPHHVACLEVDFLSLASRTTELDLGGRELIGARR